jgi:hypothetical protein
MPQTLVIVAFYDYIPLVISAASYTGGYIVFEHYSGFHQMLYLSEKISRGIPSTEFRKENPIDATEAGSLESPLRLQ